MFETVRKNQKILQVILLILIVPSFVFLGVDSYTKSGDSKTDIAKVHQESITQVELENAIKAQGQKLGITGQSLDNPNFKNAILGQLIQQKLLNFDLKSLNLQISDETLAKEILKFPEVALLKKPDGSIDAEQYRQFLQNNGLTVAQFEKLKKYEMMGSDLQSALGGATGLARPGPWPGRQQPRPLRPCHQPAPKFRRASQAGVLTPPPRSLAPWACSPRPQTAS